MLYFSFVYMYLHESTNEQDKRQSQFYAFFSPRPVALLYLKNPCIYQ